MRLGTNKPSLHARVLDQLFTTLAFGNLQTPRCVHLPTLDYLQCVRKHVCYFLGTLLAEEFANVDYFHP